MRIDGGGGDYLKKGKPISIKENTMIESIKNINIIPSNTTKNKELFSKYLINLEYLGYLSSMLYLLIKIIEVK